MTTVITRVSGRREQMKVELIRTWRSAEQPTETAIEIIAPKIPYVY